ncbi:hypothetical protein GCM10023157_04490 [Gluconacetobacter asukensis]
MPWIKLTLCHFGFGRDAGPPPSCRVAWVRVSWFDWETWADKMERALKAAREELRK